VFDHLSRPAIVVEFAFFLQATRMDSDDEMFIHQFIVEEAATATEEESPVL
jgi:hypothetical protein